MEKKYFSLKPNKDVDLPAQICLSLKFIRNWLQFSSWLLQIEKSLNIHKYEADLFNGWERFNGKK